jgi:hypothetical protein
MHVAYRHHIGEGEGRGNTWTTKKTLSAKKECLIKNNEANGLITIFFFSFFFFFFFILPDDVPPADIAPRPVRDRVQQQLKNDRSGIPRLPVRIVHSRRPTVYWHG